MKYFKSDDIDICLGDKHIFVAWDGEFICTSDKKEIDRIMSLCPLPTTREDFEEAMKKVPCSLEHVMYTTCRRMLDVQDKDFMLREQENNGICNVMHTKSHTFEDIEASTGDIFTRGTCTECGRVWISKTSIDATTFVKKLIKASQE